MTHKTVLITGSSSGIGRATALFFHQKGWNVAASMRSPQKEKELVRLPHVICPQLDVTKPETIAKAIKETIEHFGTIDVVVNNAGYGLVGPFESATEDEMKEQFETNVFGVMNVMRAILPHFRQKRSGVIVNITSMGGRMTFPLYSLYHATKWAVEGFSEGIHYELLPFGIKVKIVEPGPIDTDFYTRSFKTTQKKDFKVYDEYLHRAHPDDRSVSFRDSTESVARVIYRAATDRSGRLRFAAGKMGTLLLILRRIVPEDLFNWGVRKYLIRD